MVERNNPSQNRSEKVSFAQFTAMRLAEILSQKIIERHPEVADEYREGLSARQIALRHRLINDKGNTVRVARTAVMMALKVLIPDEEERTECRQRVIIKSNLRNAKKAHREKKGIFGISQKQRLKNSSEAGKKTRDNGTGLFGISTEEKRMAIIKSLRKRGQAPWIVNLAEIGTGLNEIDYLIYLSKSPIFIHQSGSHKGLPDIEKIADKLNNVFHNGEVIRTKGSIRSFLCRLRKAGKFSDKKK